MSNCTSIAGHFDGHADALKQYGVHHPIQHVQGYSGSHWMPPSGDYSLHIAPAAARGTANKNNDVKCVHFAGCSDGRGGVPVLYRTHHPMEEVRGILKSH